MNGLLLNPHVFSPEGFRPDARSRRPVPVPAGSVWGRSDVERLRTAGWVVVTAPRDGAAPTSDRWGSTLPRVSEAPAGTASVPGAALDEDRLWALTVDALALAGVPTGTAGLPQGVREHLDPELLRVTDSVDAGTIVRGDGRELLSLQLRRAAWRAGPGRWFLPSPPTVLVLLPDEPGADLLTDLAGQEGVRVRTSTPGERCNVDEAAFVTRVDARLRYSSYHLLDLVHGLLHSRATVAHSPDRFRRHHDGGMWLEQVGVAERRVARGLTGGSLWHAGAGLDLPEGQGYAVHGANAVPPDSSVEDRPGVLRWHDVRPALLDWLGEDDGRARPPGPSYPARKLTGVPAWALTPRTASDS